MTKLENTLSSFSEKPEILKHIDKADQLKTRDAIKEYGKRHKIWDNETFKGYYESTEHIKPETYDDYRSRAAKYGAITKAENKFYGKDMAEGKPGDKKSRYKNALWEELGTGIYALNGDGRKNKWVYRTPDGKFHTTVGKKPRRALYNAYNSKKNLIIREARRRFKEL